MIVGVVGGGQLGLMLALAGAELGVACRFLDPAPDAPARRAGDLLVGPYDDPALLARLAEGADAVTFEFENLPAEAAPPALVPSAHALATAQDRLAEKRLFERLGIPTAPFAPVGEEAGLEDALAQVGVPCLLKTRRLGYDGKGQARIEAPEDAPRAWRRLGGVPALLEGVVPFDRELSLLAVRGRDGETRAYPLVENEHVDGILRVSRAPAAPELRREAEELVGRVLAELDYVGVLAVELFDVGGRLHANELAPRVHNSGHWTIEGAATSQFENHLRAILGLPLGEASMPGAAAMVNLVGAVPPLPELLSVPGARVHLYGKAPRPGRKLGHVTVVARDADELAAPTSALRALAAAGAARARPGAGLP